MTSLPERHVMVQAMLESNPLFEGVFFTAVKTTRIFCRPTCPARKPRPENVEFYAKAEDAMTAGYRPCKRCTPLQLKGDAPAEVQTLLQEMEKAPQKRWSDAELQQSGLDPVFLRRWFKTHYGMTFHAYARARRLGKALGQLEQGESIDAAALDHGYQSLSGFRDAFQHHVGTQPGKSKDARVLVFSRILTPLGPMLALAEDRGVVLLEFTDRPALPAELEELKGRYGYSILPGAHPHLSRLDAELQAYFAGQLLRFTVPLHMPGTDFQQKVWRALLDVPHGETRTYGELARQMGQPLASRAVGRANGQNRLAIVVPCHRIVGAGGDLTGYGGGIPRKEHLLKLEKKALEQPTLFSEGAVSA
ncbi:bifunctional transcriptional activator/DNA repair enzyme AdaA [Deinococcus cellulosilyticus]|uniref:Methylated-DNA--protein-cysteine methyltransferase n=1 Tax=Deinococcus cellulosilyticus (strain DSM 18568 / NBRC 106333 / KACC 11606 / 5516J-15) TaxID=1223518 RepID=A0A511N1A5_DEIC1|nr:bifunctional transcriptional activator/DNA repair protein Ada [Deinococcus cellulosilyticus]GEM46238.1 6-O-methylguanine DNA methyltransferase [Deinococcus cellulosilyticus NBRC 106333 = KACC 11606]